MSPAADPGAVDDTPNSPAHQARWGGLGPWTALCLLALIAGAILRFLWFAVPRSLWIDECMLALSLLTRSLGSLLGTPLAFEQSAPPGFLVTEWLLAHGMSPAEFVLRAPSLVAGVGVLGLMWWVARAVLPAAAVALVVALTAASPYLVRYSAELKPYGFDAVATLAVLGFGLRVLRRPESPRVWAGLAAVGAGALVFSTPSIFVLAAAALACACSIRVRAAPTWRRHFLATILAWGCLFGVIYFVCYRPTSGNPYLHRFWQEAFLGGGIARIYALHRDWVVPVIVGEALGSLPPGTGMALQLLAIAGFIWVARQHGSACVMLLIGPLALAYLASAAGLYPVETRLMLFAAPVVLLAFAAGVVAVWDAVGRPTLRYAVAAAACLPLLLGAWMPERVVARLGLIENVGPLLQDTSYAGAFPEPVYLFARALPAWTFYATDWSANGSARAVSLMQVAFALGPNSGNTPSRGRPVVNEGDDLVLEEAGRRYVIGVPSGAEATFRPRSRRWYYDRSVDAGWGENEIRRMQRETDFCFWVFLSDFKQVELRALRDAVAAEGLRLAYERVETGTRLDRYCPVR